MSFPITAVCLHTFQARRKKWTNSMLFPATRNQVDHVLWRRTGFRWSTLNFHSCFTSFTKIRGPFYLHYRVFQLKRILREYSATGKNTSKRVWWQMLQGQQLTTIPPTEHEVVKLSEAWGECSSHCSWGLLNTVHNNQKRARWVSVWEK